MKINSDSKRYNILILGAGGWGTAIAVMLSSKHNVRLWEVSPVYFELLIKERENKTFLPGIKIPENIEVFNDLNEAFKNIEIIIFAVPSHTVREVCKKVKPWITKENLIISVVKGIENDTLKRMSEVIDEEIPEKKNIVVLSGPSHAEEVARNIPTTVVTASKEKNSAEFVQRLFTSKYFRVYTNDDIIGVELAGALKNVIAIACGISDGLGFGSNTKAALMTRGLAEIKRLGLKLGANEQTFAGLAGIGDLITTCISRYSRNRYVGEKLGLGEKIESILSSMNMVAEGVRTTKSVYQMSNLYNIEMPITKEVYNIIYNNKSAKDAVWDLMAREPKPERW